MADDQLKAFVESVKTDIVLQEQLKAAADPDAVVAIAMEAGFVISVECLKSRLSERELTDEDLEGVAGGDGWLWLVGQGGLWGEYTYTDAAGIPFTKHGLIAGGDRKASGTNHC
jgi:predicted ribosomally synthesized peptide with nif11-like leader